MLGVLALLLAAAAATALAISFATEGPQAPKTVDGLRLVLMLGVAVGAVCAIATWRLWRVTARDGRWVPVSPILPALVEDGGRLLVEKYQGRCPECGAKLRFYNRPVRWHYEPDEAGRRVVIDERSPAAECRREVRHWWTIERRTPGPPANEPPANEPPANEPPANSGR